MMRCSEPARAAFLLLYIEGLTCAVQGDKLAVRPASRITPELRELIIAHRDELFTMTLAGAGDFDPRWFPETVKTLAEFRRVFGPGCKLSFAREGGRTFGKPSAPEGLEGLQGSDTDYR